MRRLLLLSVVVCLGGGAWLDAQQSRAAGSRDLPIRRVVLYKSGIGFFEHVGRVTGDQRVAVPFTSSQLDDVLKTLTVLDLDGGVVSSVGYVSEAPLSRRLGALGLPIGENTTMQQLLSALRGVRVDVRRGGAVVTGRLLDVQSRTRARDGGVEPVDYVSVISEGGEIHAIELGAGTVLRFADAALNQRVNRYLEMVSSSRDQDRRSLAIDTAGRGSRRLYVSYISEVPVWKTTYRVVLPGDASAKPLLQGWAIVDNTAGDDWTDVELSLVAGAPQSFVQPLSQPLYTRRPQVPMPSGFLLSPQAHGATLVGGGTGGVVVDSSGAPMPGVSVRLHNNAGQLVRSTVTDAIGRFSTAGLAGRLRGEFELQGFTSVAAEFGASVDQRVVLAPAGVTETVTVTAENGSGRGLSRPSPSRRGGVVGGVVGGLADAPPASTFGAAMALATQATARDLGELFEYKLKQLVTVRQNQSAMVPIVSAPIAAERVSLWTQTDGPRPRRAVWITNTSGLTLDGGSMTVLDRDTFAGEGLVETIKPNERRLVSYAADLGMQVDASSEGVQGPQQRMTISRGTMTIETNECERIRYTARNNDATPRQLVIEHPRRNGWHVAAGGPTPAESSATAHRFQVAVAPNSSATLVVSTFHPVQSAMSLSSVDDDQLRLYLKQGALDESARAALASLVAARQALADLDTQLDVRQQEVDRIGGDQGRVRENMKSLKGSSEEKQLLERYVKQLDTQEDRLGVLQTEITALRRQRDDRAAALQEQIERLSVVPGDLATPCK